MSGQEPLHAILDRLNGFGLKRAGPRRWQAFCPLHENPPKGHRRSLCVSLGHNGLPVLFCQACGKTKTGNILKALGLSWKDIYAGRGRDTS
jgi:hypothetical protein